MIIPASHSRRAEIMLVASLTAALGTLAAPWYWRAGELLNYGDALAHLNIARRLVDTRTPGMLQIGTVWLPLPHLLMAPFAANDWLWRTGLAGAIPGVTALVMAAVAMFLLLRDRCGLWPAAVGTALLAANPSVLYLASVPMTEVLLLATMLWAIHLTLDADRPVLAGFIATLACMTRYEAWVLVPLLAMVQWHRLGFAACIRFCLAAATGPLWWLAHNWWFYGDALEFFRGEYSASAIYARQLAEGVARHPAGGNWWMSLRYYLGAAMLVSDGKLMILAVLGWALTWRRQWALALLLAAPALFLIWSLHSAGMQIYIPSLWPNTLMNIRYAVSAAPLWAAGAALFGQSPGQSKTRMLLVAIALAFATAAPSITRQEGRALSLDRLSWTQPAAAFLTNNYRGGGIALSFGDLTGALQQAGVPLREALHDGDRLRWDAAIARPDLFLHEEWALCFEGDALCSAAQRSGHYHLVRSFNKVQFWRRGQ
jgi:hypothetical protein